MTIAADLSSLTKIDNAVIASLQANPDPVELSVQIRQLEIYLARLKAAIRLQAVVAVEQAGGCVSLTDGSRVELVQEPEQWDMECNPHTQEPPLPVERKWHPRVTIAR